MAAIYRRRRAHRPVPPLAKSPGYWAGVFKRFKTDKVAVRAAPRRAGDHPDGDLRRLHRAGRPDPLLDAAAPAPIGTPGYPLGADELDATPPADLRRAPVAFHGGGAGPGRLHRRLGHRRITAGFFGGTFNTITMRTVDELILRLPPRLHNWRSRCRVRQGRRYVLWLYTGDARLRRPDRASPATTQVRGMDYVEAARASAPTP